MKFLTWNIYFDDETGVTRYPSIIESISKHNAHVVCLQEVTEEFISLLKKSELKESYQFYNLNQKTSYKNILLSKTPVTNSGTFQIPTNLERTAPYIKIKMNDKELMVVSVHLDSLLEDTQLRISQLKSVLEQSRGEENLILCGDMNFGDLDRENEYVAEYFKDAACGDLRYTYNVEDNKMASNTKFPEEASRRLDRFFIKGGLTTSNYQLHIESFSDHYPISVLIN